MRRRTRALGVGLGLGLALAAAGCGDEGDACEAEAGAYALTLGPGTGTCGALALEDGLAELSPVVVAAGTACGPRGLGSVAIDGECSTTASLEGTIATDAVEDGVLRVSSTCTPDGSTCQHSFLVTFTPAPDAGP